MRPAENPFRSERIDALDYRLPPPPTLRSAPPRCALRLPSESWEGALARLEALGYRASVVGPRGHGKTTLLDALARRLRERGHDVVRARVEIAGWSPRDARGRIFLLDGTETLGRWRWWRLLARLQGARGLVVSRHAPCALPLWIRCETDPALLAGIVAELVHGDASRALACDELRALDALWQRHAGNLRSCLLDLYDRCAA